VITVAARGDYMIARLEIDAYLLEKPTSEIGQSLKRQLDIDPRTYLGIRSFPYTLKSGESLATVAERFMGDRYRFIGLARYNDIAVPERAKAGQIILIPGLPPLKMPDDRSVDDDNEIENRLAQENLPKPPVIPLEAKPKLPTIAEITRAGLLRQSALEQLQRGFADRAANLLEEALKLYPTSAKILRDLDRARRLQALGRKKIK
jgi:LysM domain